MKTLENEIYRMDISVIKGVRYLFLEKKNSGESFTGMMDEKGNISTSKALDLVMITKALRQLGF